MQTKKRNDFSAMIISLIGLFLLCISTIDAQTLPTTLELNKPLERSIKGGETHVFQFNVKAGFYARAEVEQKNIDVVVSLFAPDGNLVVEMDSKDGSLWRESVSCIAEKNGLYRVEIKADGAADQSGSYKVKLAKSRQSAPNDSKQLVAEAHLSAGRKFYSQLKYQEAVKEYESAVSLWHELGEAELEAVTLVNLGWAYYNLSKYEQLITAHEKAIVIFQSTKDRLGEGKAFNGLGLAYSSLSSFEKALSNYETALSIRRELKDRRGEGSTLMNLGVVYYNLAQYEKAKDYYGQSLLIRKEIKDRWGESASLLNLGFIYHSLAQYEKALNYYQQSLQLYRQLNDKKDEADEALALLNIGIAFANLEDNQQALSYYKQALTLYRNADDKAQEAIILEDVASIQFESNDFQAALETCTHLLKIHRELNDKSGEAETLNSIGFINHRLGKNSIALEHFELALSLSRRINDVENQKAALFGIGMVSFVTGKFAESLNSFQEILPLLENTDDDNAPRALVHTFISIIYLILGNNSKGLEESQKAIALWHSIKNEDLTESKNFLIGALFMVLEQQEEAQGYFQQIESRLQTMDTKLKVQSLNLLGRLYWEIGNNSKASEYARQSLELSRKTGDLVAEASALLLFGEMNEDSGRNDEALKFYQQSVIISRKLNAKPLEAATLLSMMSVCDDLQNPRLAIFYGKQAINILQQVRANIKGLDKETQQSFLKEIDRDYRYLAYIMIAEGRLPEAQAILDLLKDEEYKQLIRSGETSDTIPYSKAEEAAIKVIENLATLGRRRVELEKNQTEKGKLSAVEQKELDEIYAGIEKANAELQKALEALKNAEPTAKEKLAEIESQQNLTATLEDLSKETGAGAVAIYTVVGTEDVKGADGKTNTKSKFGWVVLVTPKESKAYPIDVAELEDTVFAFRMALSSATYNPEPLAKKLYDKIFRQKSPRFNSTLEQDLQKLFSGSDKIPTIMWSLDGVLRYVPMAALHDGKNYLVEKYRHIVFTKQSLTGLSKSDKKWTILGLGDSDGGEGLDALPGVEKELKDIVCLSGETNCILNGTRRLNKEFTKEDTLRLWQRGEFPVIHIASHFSFNAVDQTASFLLIGDGRMNFADIQNKRGLFNNVDLLTLSACDTAMSANGKESESFAWLAQSLGAKTVLASLWKVSDAGTPELMMKFYKLRSENPQMPKAEAFRRAQLSLLGAEIKSPNTTTPRSGIFNLNGKKYELPLYEKDDKKPFAHPHFWSSFVLIGNWR